MGAAVRLAKDAAAPVSTTSFHQQLGNLLVYELAFFIAYHYAMTFPQDYPSPFWFPDSILLCALLLTPRKTWWMYLVAPLPIRMFLFAPPAAPAWFLVVCFVNDSLKCLLAAWLLPHDPERPDWFEHLPGFVRYLRVAVLLAPALSAIPGAAAAYSIMHRGDFWHSVQVWFLGDALANLALTPALYCLVRTLQKRGPTTSGQPAESVALAVGGLISVYLAFFWDRPGLGYPPFVLYLPIPFVLWAAVRFGPLGVSAALTVGCVFSVIATLHGRGPFAAYGAPACILELQYFVFTLATPFLFLAVLIQDRELAQQKLNQLTSKLIGVQEAERHRIGRELHDDVSQRLVALSWGLAALAKQLDERIATIGIRLREQTTDLCRDIIRLSRELRPAALKGLGLVPALQRLADQSADANGATVTFTSYGELRNTPEDVALSLYRIAQEALRNALTHSGSAHITIELSESRAGLVLTVTDDGHGFEVESARATGLGLASMIERMESKGGTLRIVSSAESGTEVTAWVPSEKASPILESPPSQTSRREVEVSAEL